MPSACLETVTTSSSVARPSSTASQTSRIVITLVTLATGLVSSALQFKDHLAAVRLHQERRLAVDVDGHFGLQRLGQRRQRHQAQGDGASQYFPEQIKHLPARFPYRRVSAGRCFYVEIL